MPTLNIGGQKVTVGDDFLKLSPEQQSATVDEIAGSLGGSFREPAPQEPASNVGQSRFEDVGPVKAGTEGFLAGISGNLRDELYGMSEASGLPKFLGGFRAPVGAARMLFGGGREDYERARDEKRAEVAQTKEQYPGLFTTGEVAGAVSLPVGAALRAPTMLGRVVQGAGVGGAYGALSGFGEGEGLGGSLAGAAMGGASGAVLGGASAPIIEGAAKGIGAALNYPINLTRSAMNPGGAAERAIGRAAKEAEQADPNFLNRLPGISGPATVMDTLGQPGRNLARSAANLSGEARDVLNQTLDPRLAGQGPRLVDWLDQGFNFPNAYSRDQALQVAARATNSAAYPKAYAAGDRAVWSPELERLTGSPSIYESMLGAVRKWKDWQVHDGFGAANPPVRVTPDGQLQFTNGKGIPTYPNLQFWDYTARNIADAAQAARNAGKTQEAARLGGLEKQLKTELDKIVPEYKKTREDAKSFFNARDALEAGQNFATQKFNLDETKNALMKMSASERKLFQDGFASQLKEIINNIADRRDVSNLISNSPTYRDKIQVALGSQKAQELQAILHVENIMQQSLKAVQGNSTTAMQILGAGAAGAGAGGWLGYDPTASGISSALALAGKKGLDKRVAVEIARALTSRDPTLLQRAIKGIAPQDIRALRAVDATLAKVGGQQGRLPALQSAGTGRAEDE